MIAENVPTSLVLLATTAIVTVPPTINAMVNFMLARRAEAKLDIVAGKAAIVAQKVEEASKQQTEAAVVIHDIHTLVNSQYGIALALILEKARTKLTDSKLIAALNSDLAKRAQYDADIVEAQVMVEDALQKLADHEAKQKVVDSKQLSP